MRKRFDVKLDAESFAVVEEFANEWNIPKTKAARRALIEYLKYYKYRKTSILIDFLGPIKDEDVVEGIELLSKEVDEEQLKKVITDAIKLYKNSKWRGY